MKKLYFLSLLILFCGGLHAQTTYNGTGYSLRYFQSDYSSIDYSQNRSATNCGYKSSDWTNDKVIKVGPGNIIVNLVTATNYISFDYGAMDYNETITFVSVNGGGTASFSSSTSGTPGCITLSNSNLLSSLAPGANGKVEIRSTLPFTQIVFTAAGLYQVLKVNNFTTSAPTNTAPTFSSLFNQETSGTMPTEVQPFTVADAETAVDSLVVTASSSNTTLIPNANITLSGTGANRKVVVTAASGQKGTATITLTVTDAQGANSTATFTVTVTDPSCSPFKITDFKLNGNATAASSIVTLTPAQGNRFGGLWNKNKIYLDQDFDISSKVFLGNEDGGADGMAFVLQNQSISAGGAGGGLGYLGITPSFAVEFDTFNNGGFEPFQDHIAIIKNGDVLGAHNAYATPFEVQMEDGQWHAVRFVWTASTKNFQVYYEGVKRFDVTVDLKASIFNNADFVYWGFVAATGGLNNLQQVDIGEYCYVPQATITPTAGTENATAALTFCSGADVVLEASYSASYKWYKDNVLLSNTSQTYIATETGSYKVETVSNIGAITSFSDAVEVTVGTAPSFSYATSSYAFFKDIAITSISPSLASGSTPVASYSVSPNLPAGLSLNTTTGVISGTPTVAATSATYTVRASSAAVCSSTYALTIEVSDNPPPVITGPNGSGTSTGATSAKSFPENSTALIYTFTSNKTVTWSLNGGEDAAKFTINSTTGAVSFSSALNFENPIDGSTSGNNTYIVVIKATDVFGLTTSQTLTVSVTNVNEAPTNIASSQTAIYEANANGAAVSNLSSTDPDAGDTFTYTLVSGAGSTDNASFSISGNQLKANTVFVFNTKSTYSIRLRTTDAGGLTFEKVFTITVLESPVATGTGNFSGTSTITAASNNVTISKGYSAPLRVTGTGLVTYSWSPSTGLSSTNIYNPIASPNQTTVYAVRVTNNMGLSTTVYVTVNVVEDYNITPNNIITPNGDGVNDKWVIGNLSAYPNNQVSIFDKAGRLVYQESNYQNGWDGTLNGLPLYENTYYFVITFEPGVKPKKGFITLVRDNN
jgi:gliding motility-associated-like protein